MYSDAGHASAQTLALARSLIWPALLIAGILLLRPHVEIVLAALAASMSRVANVKVAGVTIKMDPNRIPEPRGTISVTLSNMALLHTSFLRPDRTAAFAGRLDLLPGRDRRRRAVRDAAAGDVGDVLS